MDTVLARRDRADLAAAAAPPMTVAEFHQRQDLIKAVVTEMQEGVHYGLIPGTHDKSLWEPGAEYLRAAFRIDWTYDLLESHEDREKREYLYKVRARAIYPGGETYAQWPGQAWSKERRFWCRSTCPKPCDQDHEPSMEAEMLPHNVQDRAVKRAFVALIRNVTGTTGYFKMALDADESNASSRHTATASAVGEDVVGIRRTCPTHGEDWRPGKKAGWGGFHPVPNGPLCSQKTLLTELIGKAATDVGKTTADINVWLKAQQYKSQTLSGLNVDEKCDVYDRIRGVTVDAPPGENEQGPPLTEEPPVEDAGLAVDETGALAKLDNPGDLLNAAKDRFGRTNEEVCTALNVTEPGLITDLSGAWDQLVKLWAREPS